MKHFKINSAVLFFLALFMPNFVSAAELTVVEKKVTKVQVYERNDGTVSAWIHLDGNSRIGPNPDNPNTTCELWTYDKAVHATALAALLSGKKVTVRYVDRGEGTYWCKVKDLSIISD
ncbi:hypothetical protein QSV34_07670 [Porticoccus sp. W117]|uniref:hypothetical protein n=1 Tax=Porticoccus sp. W117 TaxID=3054777 RepID=UPI002598AF69|nr:hypothetical protein [Porticoccus sp. W117]MDM3871232.1 hypothetical protein [Porticoccus sp. W117]